MKTSTSSRSAAIPIGSDAPNATRPCARPAGRWIGSPWLRSRVPRRRTGRGRRGEVRRQTGPRPAASAGAEVPRARSTGRWAALSGGPRLLVCGTMDEPAQPAPDGPVSTSETQVAEDPAIAAARWAASLPPPPFVDPAGGLGAGAVRVRCHPASRSCLRSCGPRAAALDGRRQRPSVHRRLAVRLPA